MINLRERYSSLKRVQIRELGVVYLNFILRQEQESDYRSTEKVVEIKFSSAVQSDQNEHKLVLRIKQSDAFGTLPNYSWEEMTIPQR